MIKRLERHLKKHPNDKQARMLLEALKNNQYKWKGRSIIVVREGEEKT